MKVSSLDSRLPEDKLEPHSIAVRLVSALGYASIGTCFAVGIWLQSLAHLNHDVAWIAHSAGWLLEGKRFGVDIIDVNPPLIWFVSLPAALLAKSAWVSEPVALRIWVWTLCLLSLYLLHRLVEPLRRDGRALQAIGILVGAVFSMAVLPAGAFGQREHLSFVLALPYGLLMASRLSGSTPSTGLAVSIGVLAGVAFGFKPWMLAVPALLEVLRVAYRRSFREVLRPETLALSGTLLAYALSLLIFAPAYLSEVVPMAVATYWAYDGTGALALYWRAATSPLFGAILMLALARRFWAHSLALLVMFAGYSLNYWAQGKGFAYHAYPALAVAVTLFVTGIGGLADRLLSFRMNRYQWLKPILMLFLPLLLARSVSQWIEPVRTWINDYDMETGYVGAARSHLIKRINTALPEGGRVYGFSSHPFPAFPTMSYTRAEWASAWVAQFTLPAQLARKRIKDPERLAALDRAVQRQRDDVLREMSEGRPDIVLIETKTSRLGMRARKFDDIAFYSEDPRFAELWSRYREAEPVGSIRIFVREGAKDQADGRENTKYRQSR